MNSTLKIVSGPLVLVALYGLWGIGWGLPSEERSKLFLNASTRTPEFYAKVAQARQELYAKMETARFPTWDASRRRGRPIPSRRFLIVTAPSYSRLTRWTKAAP